MLNKQQSWSQRQRETLLWEQSILPFLERPSPGICQWGPWHKLLCTTVPSSGMAHGRAMKRWSLHCGSKPGQNKMEKTPKKETIRLYGTVPAALLLPPFSSLIFFLTPFLFHGKTTLVPLRSVEKLQISSAALWRLLVAAAKHFSPSQLTRLEKLEKTSRESLQSKQKKHMGTYSYVFLERTNELWWFESYPSPQVLWNHPD